MSNRCKPSNVLTISEDAKAKARGAKALATCKLLDTPQGKNFVPIDTGIGGGCDIGA